jgi:Zinc finger, C3HC4 type (RING finger)
MSLHFILILDTSPIGSRRQQQCPCCCCDYSYISEYDCNYEYLSDDDYVCEEEGEAIDIAEDYERQQSKMSKKRNQKTSIKKELRKIKVAGQNGSKNARSRFAKHAVAARDAERDEKIAVGRLRGEIRAATKAMQGDPRLADRALSRRNRQWHHQRQHQPQHHEQQRILPAEHLIGAAGGDSSDDMYQRLVEIANGAEITPEDYDLLLLLDENNVRSTLQVSQVEQFELLVLDDDEKQSSGQNDKLGTVPPRAVSRQSLGTNSLCLICLQAFAQMENGFELRRLPCQHAFCRACIELWFADFGAKCPDLSCFWNSKDTSEQH